jgi:hypothetical protein
MDGFPIFSQKIRWISPFIISALLCRKVNGLTWPIFDALPTGKKNLLMGISKHSITIYGQRKKLADLASLFPYNTVIWQCVKTLYPW